MAAAISGILGAYSRVNSEPPTKPVFYEDGLPGARVATLALLPLFHHEAAKPTYVYPFVRTERLRDQNQNGVHCDRNLGLTQFSLGRDILN